MLQMFGSVSIQNYSAASEGKRKVFLLLPELCARLWDKTSDTNVYPKVVHWPASSLHFSGFTTNIYIEAMGTSLTTH